MEAVVCCEQVQQIIRILQASGLMLATGSGVVSGLFLSGRQDVIGGRIVRNESASSEEFALPERIRVRGVAPSGTSRITGGASLIGQSPETS